MGLKEIVSSTFPLTTKDKFTYTV